MLSAPKFNLNDRIKVLSSGWHTATIVKVIKGFSNPKIFAYDILIDSDPQEYRYFEGDLISCYAAKIK